MTERLKISLVYLFSAFFIMLNTYLVYKEFFWGLLIPIAALVFLVLFFKLNWSVFLVALVTPLSVLLDDYDLGASLAIPSEPLLIAISLLFILKVMFEGFPDKRIFRQPLTIVMIISLIWLLITSITSTMPVVSFKFLLSRLWFVIPMFFVGSVLFKDTGNIRKFIWCYTIALVVVIFYTTYMHSQMGFSEKAGNWVMKPFYNDHTAYGAILAFFIPPVFGLILLKQETRLQKILAFSAIVILFTGLFLSYSRAAWLSFAIAITVMVLVLFKVKFRYIFTTILFLLAVFFTFKFEILDRLEKNKQDASANFIEHVQSISNISSDASNLERINRWQSAFRMYHEHEIVGWGPGTYQFQYAPFQRSSERTIISTNLGDVGNAHSEYIGPLAEQGMPGMIIVIVLFVTIIITGLQAFKRGINREVKVISLTLTLSFITYFTHGFLNNFLDTDKASVPFWAFAAALVSIRMYYCDDSEALEKEKGK